MDGANLSDRRHHHGNIGGDRFIFGKILEAVLPGDRLELGFVLGVGAVQKCRALPLFHYRRHVLLGGDEPLDVLLRELDLRCLDLRRCAGREGSESNSYCHTGETKQPVHSKTPTLRIRHPYMLPVSKFRPTIAALNPRSVERFLMCRPWRTKTPPPGWAKRIQTRESMREPCI